MNRKDCPLSAPRKSLLFKQQSRSQAKQMFCYLALAMIPIIIFALLLLVARQHCKSFVSDEEKFPVRICTHEWLLLAVWRAT